MTRFCLFVSLFSTCSTCCQFSLNLLCWNPWQCQVFCPLRQCQQVHLFIIHKCASNKRYKVKIQNMLLSRIDRPAVCCEPRSPVLSWFMATLTLIISTCPCSLSFIFSSRSQLFGESFPKLVRLQPVPVSLAWSCFSQSVRILICTFNLWLNI